MEETRQSNENYKKWGSIQENYRQTIKEQKKNGKFTFIYNVNSRTLRTT